MAERQCHTAVDSYQLVYSEWLIMSGNYSFCLVQNRKRPGEYYVGVIDASETNKAEGYITDHSSHHYCVDKAIALATIEKLNALK